MTALPATAVARRFPAPISPGITWATALRILAQLRNDRRTVMMMLGVPGLLMVLLRYVIDNRLIFDRFGPMLLGIFPFIVMFIVTSIATLRERTSGTLERLMTTPLGKLDLLLGYAIAFGLAALVQVGIVMLISVTWLGLTIPGSIWLLVLIAVLDALLGMALGLFFSAFARTEFQAVQFMPAIVLPQTLLCGLVVPRAQMTAVLRWISDALPLSYAVEAMQRLTRDTSVTAVLVRDIAVIAGSAALALVLGAVTLRRRTP